MIERRSLLIGGTALLASTPFGGVRPAKAATAALRVAVLKFGSVNWLMKTVVAEGLDKKHNLSLDIVEVASNSAGPVALLGNEVDVMVSDWPWAMRQRSLGEPVKFSPYSSSLGAIMVGKDGGIKSLADLKGKRLGVAGTSIDKSWILLRAYARKTLGEDMSNLVTPVFGAAPLIAEEMRNGRLDAVLNFWTFSARLAGYGFVELLSVADIIRGLEVDPAPPLVGFVWREKNEAERPQLFSSFQTCVQEANGVLASSDDAWARLKPHMRVDTDTEFEALKRYYRDGIPNGWSAVETASAQKLLQLLKDLGQKDLIGRRVEFDPQLFNVVGN